MKKTFNQTGIKFYSSSLIIKIGPNAIVEKLKAHNLNPLSWPALRSSRMRSTELIFLHFLLRWVKSVYFTSGFIGKNIIRITFNVSVARRTDMLLETVLCQNTSNVRKIWLKIVWNIQILHRNVQTVRMNS